MYKKVNKNFLKTSYFIYDLKLCVVRLIDNKKFPFCRTWDKLTTYVVDHIHLKHNVKLINKETNYGIHPRSLQI